MGFNAIIYCDNEGSVWVLFQKSLYALLVHSITLSEAVINEPMQGFAGGGHKAIDSHIENHRPHDSIGVVVTVNRDHFPLFDTLSEAVKEEIGILHRCHLAKVKRLKIEQMRDLFRRIIPF